MKVLSVENLTKSYGEKVLFNHISFAISENQKIGLIGINGTGKSTLLKIIAGLDSAEKGDIHHPNEYRIELLSQDPELDEDKTILEQIFYGPSPQMKLFREYELALAMLQANSMNEKSQAQLLSLQQKMDSMNGWEANTQAKTILSKLGIHDIHQPIGQLSGGQKKRVALAQAFIQPADLLILDEPTNHLDNETVDWLEQYLSKYSGAILLVTHDRYFLNRITNRIFELDRGKLHIYEGNYEYFLEMKADREQQESESEKKKKNILRTELAWLKKGAKARTTKQKARIQRIEQMQDDKIVKVDSDIDISLGSSRLGKKVIELHHVSKAFGQLVVIKDLDLIITPKSRIGIIGPNGIGKSTLLKLLTNQLLPDSGEIEIGQTVKFAYYKQDDLEMDKTMRVIDYIKEGAEVIHTSDGKEISASQMLERFLFDPYIQWAPIEKLSGGERKRLYLLRKLMEEPNVLLLDEPTNDLDIQTLSILEDYIEQFNGVVIVVSHDRYFLDRTVDHLLVYEGNGEINHFYGNYSDYMEQKKLQHQEEVKAKESNNNGNKNLTKPANKKRKLSYREQKEWDEIEYVIEQLESKAEKIQNEIALAGSDFQKIEELYKEEKEITGKLDYALERWTELSALIEEIEQENKQS